MSDVRVIAVSFEGGQELHHITHIWTAGGATGVQRAVEDLWTRRCRYYTMSPSGRVDVVAEPARRPNPIAALFGRRVRGRLKSQTMSQSARDGLLLLPKLPSPTRPRRSRAQASTLGSTTETPAFGQRP